MKMVLNKNNQYSIFVIPKGIRMTKKVKRTKATILYGLYVSEDSSAVGSVSFEMLEHAKKVFDLNKDRKDVVHLELIIKINDQWYKDDCVTPRFPKEVTISDVKKDIGITDLEISKMFGFASKASYSTSSAKKRYESGLIAFYKLIKNNNYTTM